MEIRTYTVYKFDELSDTAKEKARSWFRDCLAVDCTAFEDTESDAEQIGLKIISLNDHYPNEGEFIDGAFNCANKILENHGEDCETYKTAKGFLAALDALPATDNEESRADDADAIEGDFLQSLLEDYRIILNKNVEYQFSDESVDENIRANEYDFTENGKIA